MDSTMAESEALSEDDAPDSHAEGAPEKEARAQAREGENDVAPETSPGFGPPWVPLAVAVGLPVLLFFVLPPLTKSGLWDPYELNVADLARRVALNLHGASSLALEGADNSLPGLNDLGRPQIPFTSIALGFKFFGLHEWAGRAPLAIWGVLGVLATYGFVSRLVDKRAGMFSAIALSTMPLYFVQARTMLGDIVMMAALAMSFGGFAVATFGARQDDERDGKVRSAWLVIALVGAFVGFFTRGALIGVGVPVFAVGAGYLVARGSGQRFDGLGNAAGLIAAALGAGFSAWGISVLGADHFNDWTVPFGGALMKPALKYPTFDFMVGQLAPSLAPWSAFVPFAFGRMFAAPLTTNTAASLRESQTRLVLIIGAAAAFVAHGWIANSTEFVTFSGAAILAAGCGIALRDYERGAHPSVAVAVGTALLLGMMHHELKNNPEKALYAFSVVSGATFPESFKATAQLLWTVALVGFAGVGFLTWAERDPEREPFEPKGYLRVLLYLHNAWDGMLALGYFAMVAGASLAGLAVWIGTWRHAAWLPRLSSQMHDVVLNAWWITAFAPFAVIFLVYFWCDVWVWAFDAAKRSSGAAFSARATRGFEPFEELGLRLKESRLLETVPKLIAGKLVVTEENLDDGVGPVCLFVLAPLMYLQVPAAAFLALTYKVGMRPLVAGLLAVPSGVAVFLALGFIGTIFRGSRAAFLAFVGALLGALLCTSFYPALANQLSPKEIFESYQRLHKTSEPLALFGVGGRTAAYYAGGQPLIVKDNQAAYDWLMGGGGGRRFMAVRAEELSRLNRTYRERSANHENVPVLDARSSQIVLVASSLAPGEKNQNPLDKIFVTGEPSPQRKLDVNLDDKLQVLGWDLVDASGRRVDHVAAGKPYHIRTYFKVLAPISSEWDFFIHIDGFGRRHNGDHKFFEGKYPMSLWLKDDILVDDHEFKLEPNFNQGSYTFWFGLNIGETTRMKVKSGASDGNDRINGGQIRVQ
jgi:4-amino-4-deoxy-L-arabinose transferase-like glycosyltransferase